MSVKLMSLVWEMDIKNVNSKIVLLALADHENDFIEDRCFPSVSHLSKKCSISKSSVFRALNDLENLGYLKRINQKNDKGNNLSNLYKITLPYEFKVVKKEDTSVTETLPSVTETPPLVSQCDTNHKSITIKESNICKEDILEIYEHWKQEVKEPGWGLTSERKSKIKSALERGVKYDDKNVPLTKEQLKELITLMSKNDYYMSKNLKDLCNFLTQKRMTDYLEGRLKKQIEVSDNSNQKLLLKIRSQM